MRTIAGSDSNSVFAGLFLFATLFSASARGAEVRFDRLDVTPGFAQSTVLCIAGDHEGMVWFGTEQGLHRYNPKDPNRLESPPQGELSATSVWSIAIDDAGGLWIGSADAGLVAISPSGVVVARYRHQLGDADSLASNYVRTLAIDHQGGLWIGHRDRGLDHLDLATGKIAHFRSDPADPGSLSDDHIYALAVNDQAIWIGTDRGLGRLDRTSGELATYRHVPWNEQSLSDDRVRSLLVDRDGMLWTGTLDGLNRFDPNTGLVERFRLGDHVQSVRALLQDSSGRLWAGGYDGVFLFDAAAETFVPVGAGSRALGVEIMALFEGPDNTIWAGTNLSGAAAWNPKSSSFGQQSASSSPALDRSRVVTSFVEDARGRLWFGTFGGGLRSLDRSTGIVTTFRHAEQDRDSLSDDRVMVLEPSLDGRLWVGTLKGGLNLFDPASGTFEHFVHDAGDPTSLPANGVMSLLADHPSGGLWVGTFGGGLARLEANAGRFVRYRNESQQHASLAGARITSLARTSEGFLWVGTDGDGLVLIDPSGDQAVAFRNDPKDTTTLGADSVFSLFVDSSGELWVGTRGGGLGRLRAPKGWWSAARFENRSVTDGLPNPIVYGILPDDLGGLWLSTNEGLSRFDKTRGTFHNFTPDDGLQGAEFNFGAAYRSPSGELFFGGVNGFNAFFPDSVLGTVSP